MEGIYQLNIHSKILTKQGREGNSLNPLKDTYENPTANIIHLKGRSLIRPPQIRNKAKMSLSIASIQHYTGGPSWCNIARRRIKVWRSERKKETSLRYRQNSCLCRKLYKESIKLPEELIYGLGTATGYRSINEQFYFWILATSNWTLQFLSTIYVA